jgi:hypothetical protein
MAAQAAALARSWRRDRPPLTLSVSGFMSKNFAMKRLFAATVWREGKAYVSQCLELDIG